MSRITIGQLGRAMSTLSKPSFLDDSCRDLVQFRAALNISMYFADILAGLERDGEIIDSCQKITKNECFRLCLDY
jgi:hypothetical protein